jgi:hypothetical protein
MQPVFTRTVLALNRRKKMVQIGLQNSVRIRLLSGINYCTSIILGSLEGFGVFLHAILFNISRCPSFFYLRRIFFLHPFNSSLYASSSPVSLTPAKS